ncbi:SDR family NAD(P)-dependent oxidoreductase [Marinomonas pollencensis]|uniref:NAD(P)-dependent dehydrogenase (Short-subunit alcohol dehydrogenase family) n=1 Tax=Marinomonas pollencensis TaxID=491954 RepID=A0A3E0DRI6_9GAMM|nr:SDR family NAD(P)-dependent oxidoreductase [Marinomonas pollencensis]REG84952.1 NAD(P)-dependent dehydrogenase (short-subunit alcohol dehydrogenase family) [Marinomonas pollencensis]
MPFNALIIGASSTIAQAIITHLVKDPDCQRVFTVSRTAVNFSANKVISLLSDYSEASIDSVCQSLHAYAGTIDKVLICNGVLHQGTEDSSHAHLVQMPEKKLEDITIKQLADCYLSNSIIPMLWISRLLPILKREEAVKVAAFSARIGSISDNKAGGWYSYRASKAALNMLIQNSAIEYARRAPNVKLIAFHPGTTDTPLSKPFQRNVAKNKLFTAEFVAEKALSVLDQATPDQQASFLDWDNQPIEW